MNIQLLDEKEMSLLGRKRINFYVDSEFSTPSEKEILEELAKKLKVDKELIAIRHIYQRFGSRKAKVIVHVYNSKEDLKILEKKGKKKEEKPKEAVKEKVREDGKEASKEQKSK